MRVSLRVTATGFAGDRALTRQEMAVMLYRYVNTINGNKGQLGSYAGMGGTNDVADWSDGQCAGRLAPASSTEMTRAT